MQPTIRRVVSGNPLFYLFAKTWHYSAGNRWALVSTWIMFIVAECVSALASPLIWAKIMTVIQNEGITHESIHTHLWLLFGLLATTIVFWLIHGPARVLERNNAFRVRANYRNYLLQGVMMLPLSWHTNHHSGDTIDKVEKGTSGLFSFAEKSFEVIYAIARLVVSFGMLTYFFPMSSPIVFIMLSTTVYIVIKFDNVLMGQYKQLNRCENEITSRVFDSISNITSVIILRVEQLVHSAIMKKVLEPFALFKLNNKINEFKWSLAAMCCTLTVVTVLGTYFWRHLDAPEGILVGDIYLLYKYLGNIGDVFSRFTGMYSDVVKRRAQVHNAEELAKEFRSESFANHVLPQNWHTLSFSDLSFSYNGSDESHLDQLSLSLRRGEKVAFVGRSGSGKTTLLKIMRGLDIPTSLDLRVDGERIDQGFDGISRAIALVPQMPEVFNSTILDNITLGAIYEMEQVLRYTDMACFTDVALGLPRGFESSVSEKGVSLSGGQQQRLALARGLLASDGKSIVLLDEPTSSLDSVTERKIYGNIFRAFKGKTIVSTIHRLHLLQLFDRVCMFEAGKIVGSGSFAELLRNCPQFLELWQQYEKNPTED